MLLAILLVAIATILAAAIGYASAMSARRSAASIAFDEGLLVAEAAEALAAFGLRADLRAGAEYDYPGEAWAKPVGPIEIAPGVMLEASLEDVQGRFNLNSLVTGNGVTDPEARTHLSATAADGGPRAEVGDSSWLTGSTRIRSPAFRTARRTVSTRRRRRPIARPISS